MILNNVLRWCVFYIYVFSLLTILFTKCRAAGMPVVLLHHGYALCRGR